MSLFDYFMVSAIVVFYTVFLARSALLHLTGIRVFVLGAGKKGFEAILELFFLFGLLFWTGEALIYSLHLPFQPLPDFLARVYMDIAVLKLIGVCIITGGVVIFILALIAFGASWRIGIDTKNPGSLVTGGIFRMTRNPIFLFMDLFFIGTFLIYGSVFFLASAVLVVAGIHRQILNEEKYLFASYGASYREYSERVRRYI